MVVLIPFRDEYTAPYLVAAFASASGRAVRSLRREKRLLRQTIAICEAQVELALSFPDPPGDAPIRAALAQAIEVMRRDHFPASEKSELAKELRGLDVCNAMRRYAKALLGIPGS